MLGEISIEQYPEVNWANELEGKDGDPEDIFGLVGFRIGPEGYRLSQARLLVPYYLSGGQNSLLVFGHLGRPRLWVYSEPGRLFDLRDGERITAMMTSAQNLIAANRQLSVAAHVIALGSVFVESLRAVAVHADPETVSEVGIVEEFISSQRERLLMAPAKYLVAAQELKRNGVERVETISSLLNERPELIEAYWPSWIVEQYTGQDKDTQNT